MTHLRLEDTTLDLDLSASDYLAEYHRFCAFHRWDVHQDGGLKVLSTGGSIFIRQGD